MHTETATRRSIRVQDEHLLDGPCWWLPWLGGVAVVLVLGLWVLLPGDGAWSVGLGVAVAVAGLVPTYVGVFRGNPPQRALSVLVLVVLLGLGGLLTTRVVDFGVIDNSDMMTSYYED